MKIKEAKIFINSQPFTFAKSYADTFPHTYLQRAKTTDENKFEQFISLIRKEGLVYNFFKKQYVYLFIDDFIYWEVGRPIKCIQVLNRASIHSLNQNKQHLVSQHIADTLLAKLNDREIYLDTLLNKEIKSIQDIRQIKFLMDTERRINGGGKNIIDNYKQEVKYE
jgi:hypothetical protein